MPSAPKNPIQLLKYRMGKGKKSSCVLIYGGKGKGKSWLMLHLSELIDKRFGLGKVKFSPIDVFKFLDENDSPGHALGYDEAGVGSNARDANTRLNKHMGFIAQVVRPSRITVFFIAPGWKLIDSQVRGLMDYAIEVVGFDEQSGQTEFKFFKVENSSNVEEPIKKHLVFQDENGRDVKHTSWVVHAPSRELREGYDPMRKEYSRQIYKDAAETGLTGEDVRFGKKKVKAVKPLLSDMAKEVIAAPDKFKLNGKIDTILIMDHFKVGRHTGDGVCRMAKEGLLQV